MIWRLVSRLRNDERGIALQTIIIIVVLLAIAGAVAAVLLTRAGAETDRLEGETDRWSDIANETGCNIANGVWSNPGDPTGTCGPPNGGQQQPAVASDFDNQPGACASNNFTYLDDNPDGDDDPLTNPAGTCS